jgi:hypothetical protein
MSRFKGSKLDPLVCHNIFPINIKSTSSTTGKSEVKCFTIYEMERGKYAKCSSVNFIHYSPSLSYSTKKDSAERLKPFVLLKSLGITPDEQQNQFTPEKKLDRKKDNSRGWWL